MKCDRSWLQLYAVTDRTWLGKQTLSQQVEQAILGGVTCVQLREKALDEDAFLEEAIALNTLCKRYHVPFIVNDHVDIACRCGADGVHVGQSDMEAGDVRAKIGPDRILGVSAQTVAQAKKAELAGADYLGVGAMFSTSTKLDADSVSYETLQEICRSVSIPVVAIGGISAENMAKLSNSGIAGVALVSAIFASAQIRNTCRTLRKLAEENHFV